AAPNSGATGSYAWTIPTDVCATVRVRLTDTARPQTWDKSDMSFTILPLPELYLDSPIGGEEWRIGSQHEILWHDNGGRISNNLTIQYSTNGGTSWKPIATGVSNTGVYPWIIPEDLSATCLIKIFDANRTATTDESPDAFKIIIPLITITSPNGGEWWAGRDRAPITWTSEGTVSNNLSLEWSPNGGGDWTVISNGVANTGSYTWTVPTDWASDNVLFRISDGDRTAVTDISNAVFHIVPYPTITVTSPASGQQYALGDTTQITWTSKGLSIPNNLTLELSEDGFASTQLIEVGVPNTGSYTWFLNDNTKCAPTLKVRISAITNWVNPPETGQFEVKAISSGYFLIRGSLNILFPNGNESWVAKSTQNITWQTRGDISSVRLEYSVDDGVHWSGIIASTVNENIYAWTLPDIKSNSVKVRVSNPQDAATFDISDTAFNIVYATVTFKVLDYDTLQHLQDVNFNEPASGWSDSGLSSPVTRTEMYPYGTYTTFVTKSNYIDSSVTWNPAKTGTTPYVVTCYLENSASAQVTWEAILTYSFSPGNDTLNAVGSLQRKGKLIGTTPEEKADMAGATFTIYEPDGTTVRRLLTSVAPSASGTYTFTYADTNFASGTVYPGVLSITYRDKPYLTTANVDVGSEILQYEFFNNTATKLAQSVSTIEAAVAGGTAQTRADIEASRVKLVSDIAATESNIKSHVTSVLASTESTLKTQLTTAETGIKAKVQEARDLTETGMKSQILNTENLVKSGETLTIRYRTFSGLSPTIDVYNADNALELSKGKMTEIGSTGIYEYDVSFSQGWGKGDFTVICSESSKGVLDALTITVIKTNIEAVYNQVSAVLGSTAGISGLKQVADAMNSQFSILETALSKVGKDLLKDVKDATSSANALESVYSQLTTMAKSVKQITGETGMNLEKLYQVSADKKNDIVYLKNKTQEMKAAVELTKKMTDNMANKPITQTWYEYKK
ncbi:MAG: hypothetical protein PHG40_04755, partial [Candidatus Omnitrophica bacterium]|nr:hypothetical protein [Candidatus Omnitrophota bacterium]